MILENKVDDGLILSDEFKQKLMDEGINPLTVKSFSTINNTVSRLIITRIVMVDGTEKNISFLFYSNSAEDSAHIISGVSLLYTPRRIQR